MRVPEVFDALALAIEMTVARVFDEEELERLSVMAAELEMLAIQELTMLDEEVD